jgi:aspartyl protease family protein
MMEGQSLDLVYTVLLLVLVGSALFSRAIPVGQMIRMFLVWVGIFAFVILIFSFRDEMKQVGTRVVDELGLSSLFGLEKDIVGSTLRLRKSSDGHFWADGSINGQIIRFLIDSGATRSAVSQDTLDRAGLEAGGFPVIVNTANGSIEAYRAVIPEMQIGPITVIDHAVFTSDNFGSANVLGMNFLSEFESWRIEGNEMILEPVARDDR